jgi:hypothetical protein
MGNIISINFMLTVLAFTFITIISLNIIAIILRLILDAYIKARKF